MKRVPVSSSNVLEVGYERETKTLEVQFKSNAVYQYAAVPLATYEALLLADSVGGYLAQHIKPHFACKKVA